MPDSPIRAFAHIASQVIGDLDRVAADAEPYPWFTQNIYREKDLQWTGFIGPIGSEAQALGFGLNLEFTGAWRRAYRKIKADLPSFTRLLRRYPDYEWHWQGRPGMIAKNPPRRSLSPNVWASEVDVTSWLSQLEDILERRVMWSDKVPMRPQIGIVRLVGLMSQIDDSALIRQNVQDVVQELEPLKSFLDR